MTTSQGASRASAAMLGRDQDLQLVQNLLRTGSRLITLRGPGGIGKTTLARELAHAVRDAYEHVIFVDLSALRDPQQVLPTISAHLPVQHPHADTMRNIVEFARDARALLVLDNFEQVLPAAGRLAELLQQAPSLQLVVTSRAALHLHDECEHPLDPLALPGGWRDAVNSPAVQLFVRRARATMPRFELTEENAEQVMRLCEALEGVPLALELAASRLRTFALPDLLARLEHPLGVLKADFRDRPERLRSLRAAVQWSYDLLIEEDREVFECCAVFAGSFTPDALVAVWGDEDVLDKVEHLIEQSFLQRVEGPATRWKMLQPLRELALERLEGQPRAEGWRERHAHYCFAVLEDVLKGHGGFHPQARERLLPDYPNFRQGLVWMTEHGTPEEALTYLRGISGVWMPFAMHSEARPLAEAVLARPAPGQEQLRMRGLHVLANLLLGLGDDEALERCIREHHALSETHGNEQQRVMSMVGLAVVHSRAGRYEESLRLNRQVIDCYEQLNGETAQELSYRNSYALATINSVPSLLATGQYEVALDYALKAIERYELAGRHAEAPTRRLTVASVLLHLGRTTEAAEEILVSLRNSMVHGYRDSIANAASSLMQLTQFTQPRLAAQFAAFARQESPVKGGRGHPYTSERYARELEALRAALGEAEFEAAWREGERLSHEDVLRLAEGLVTDFSRSTSEKAASPGIDHR